MKRREFITLLGGAAAGWPLAASAQQPERPVIGLLLIGTPSSYDLSGFRQGLKDAGYVEGQNLAIEYRFANDDPARLPELASDLVRRQVRVIATVANGLAARAAKDATNTIPIVSRVSCAFLVCMLSPLPRRSDWTYCFAHSPSRFSLPRKGGRVGLRIVLFEDCSAFTRVTACTLALSSIRDTLIEGFSHFVTSMTAPIASGWSGCRVGFAPTGKRRLFTAHTHKRHSTSRLPI